MNPGELESILKIRVGDDVNGMYVCLQNAYNVIPMKIRKSTHTQNLFWDALYELGQCSVYTAPEVWTSRWKRVVSRFVRIWKDHTWAVPALEQLGVHKKSAQG